MARSKQERARAELRNDNPDLNMRPVLGAIIGKVLNHSAVRDQADVQEWLIKNLGWRYARQFHQVHGLERLIASLHLYAYQEATSGRGDFSVTGDDAPKSGSLLKPDLFNCSSFAHGEPVQATKFAPGRVPMCDEHFAEFAPLLAKNFKEVEGYAVPTPPSKINRRNDVTPGPSHKSPIAYAHGGHFGFTIPGFEGKWLWSGPGKPPDMDKVVETIAAGLRLAEAPDLKDKALKKEVRKIIWEHTPEWDDPKPGQISCSSGDWTGDIGEEWAVHVRKLIWRALAGKSGSS